MAGSAHAEPREVRGTAAGSFDFYVLALSWSPGFCAADERRREREQCGPDGAQGFVVHGLWPQFERGYPVSCEPSGRMPSRPALEEAKGVYPDEGLARYQWRKHGTCSGSAPAAYFRDVRRARDRVRIPTAFQGVEEAGRMSPREIEARFLEANAGLRPDMVAVTCRRGALQEVRICLDRDLRGFRACPEVDRDACRGGGEIRIDSAP